MIPSKSDRATRAMQDYNRRVQITYKAIEDNPGIETRLLCGSLSLQLHVRPEKVDEYIRTLADARKVVPDMGRLWTLQAYENYNEAKRRQEAFQEEEKVRKAKETGQVPLEAYDTEGER